MIKVLDVAVKMWANSGKEVRNECENEPISRVYWGNPARDQSAQLRPVPAHSGTETSPVRAPPTLVRIINPLASGSEAGNLSTQTQ